MSKKLEDYLHLYKKVPIAIIEEGAEPTSHYVEGFDWCNKEKEVIAERTDWGYENIKPILKPLSMVSIQEWKNLEKYTFETDVDSELKADKFFAFKSYARIINWLRNNHFDVDGLIDAGLALDSTKL